MVEKFKKFFLKTYNNVFVLSGLLIILFAGALYLLLGKGAADTLIEQMLHREQVITRSGASSISSFFIYLGKSVSMLSVSDDIKKYDQSSKISMDQFISLWAGTPVGAINLPDSSGMLRFNSTREQTEMVKASISDRDYFKWAKSAKPGEVKVFPPILSRLGPTAGTFIVPIASPVIDDGVFKGALMASSRLGELTDTFLTPLKISDQTRVYIVNDDGTVFYADDTEIIGTNVLRALNNEPFLGAKNLVNTVQEVFKNGGEGKMVLALPEGKDVSKLKQYLIAYSPLNLGASKAYIVIMTPKEDALKFMTQFYFRDLGLAGLAFLGFLIITIRVSKIKGYKEGIETEHKLHSS